MIVVEVAVVHDVAIPLAPFMTILNQRNSVEVHLGYNVDGSYDAGLLLFSVATSLIFKRSVNLQCFTGEMVPAVHGMEDSHCSRQTMVESGS